MKIFRLPVFIVLFCAIIGCKVPSSGSEEPEVVAQINTDSQKYELTDSTFITLSIENVSASTIYYNSCDSRTIEEVENGQVLQSVVFINPCMCNCVMPVRPGEQSELAVKSYFILQHKDKLELSEGVSYQIFPHFYKDKEQKKRISLAAVRSNNIILISE